MPSINELQASPCKIATDRQSNAQAVATCTAPTSNSVRSAVALFGFTITASGAVAASVEAIVTDGTTTAKYAIPAATLSQPFTVMFPNGHPFVGVAGQAITVTVPALGSGIVCDVEAYWTYVNPL